MVTLNKIYTKTGDDGSTALGTGDRVQKYDLRIETYGTVDEANSAIGLAREHTQHNHPELDTMLERIQNDMFDLGADLCMPDRGEKLEYEPLRITKEQVERLEKEIDKLNASILPLRSFILPFGQPGAAALHLARTITRRAERRVVELSQDKNEPVSEAANLYLNRLSDFLFVASRALNNNGEADVLWVPGANR